MTLSPCALESKQAVDTKLIFLPRECWHLEGKCRGPQKDMEGVWELGASCCIATHSVYGSEELSLNLLSEKLWSLCHSLQFLSPPKYVLGLRRTEYLILNHHGDLKSSAKSFFF